MELMEMKYKETEVGLIPEDWICIEFGKLISNLCYGPRFSSKDYSRDGNVKTIRGTDINLLGDINYEQVPKAKLPYELVREHKLLDGDLVMITTADCGLTGVYIDDGFPYIASAYAVRISLNPEAHPLFFKYIYQTNFAKKQIELYIRKGTVGNLPGSDIYKFKFPLPPTLQEQKAIATALSDVDELISNLELLITKKKAIKLGVMQQLLTPPHKGGKRLDGFTGEWVEKKLGDLFDFKTSNSKKHFFDLSGDLIVMDMGSISVEGKILKSKRANCNFDILKKNDLIMPKDDIGGGNIIGKVAYIDKDDSYLLSDHVFRLKTLTNHLDALYFSYLINSSIVNTSILKVVSGSAQLGLGLNTIKNLTVCYNSNPESQIRIGKILLDIDLELEQLETKKTKYQHIKQGMMQELLTGKTRLV